MASMAPKSSISFRLNPRLDGYGESNGKSKPLSAFFPSAGDHRRSVIAGRWEEVAERIDHDVAPKKMDSVVRPSLRRCWMASSSLLGDEEIVGRWRR